MRLRSDYVRKQLAGLRADARSHSATGGGLYTEDRTSATYDRLAQLARTVLSTGSSVIVDATFLQHDSRAQFRELAAQLGVEFTILDVQAGNDDLDARLHRRARNKGEVSEADTAVLHHQRSHAQPLDEDELAHVVTVDNRGTRAATAVLEPLDQLFMRSA